MALTDLMKGFGADKFPLPPIAGQYKGKGLVICGDAACVWDDLERFGCANKKGRGSVEKDGWDFLTVNRLVQVFPGRIEHAYSNEPAHLKLFIEARRNEYKKEFEWPRNTHSCNKGAQWRWPWSGHGTSGLGATLVGVGLGYDRIVLCGIPLDDSPHNGEPSWRQCAFTRSEAPGTLNSDVNSHWKEAIKVFDGKVRSMSGRTRNWLGGP